MYTSPGSSPSCHRKSGNEGLQTRYMWPAEECSEDNTFQARELAFHPSNTEPDVIGVSFSVCTVCTVCTRVCVTHRGAYKRRASLRLAVHVSGHAGAGRALVHLPVVIVGVQTSLIHTRRAGVYGVNHTNDICAFIATLPRILHSERPVWTIE